MLLCMLVLLPGCAQTTIQPEFRDAAKEAAFEAYVDQAAALLSVPMPRVVLHPPFDDRRSVRTLADVDYDRQALEFQSLARGPAPYVLRVAPSFVRYGGVNGLRFLAAHEICHIKLGHAGPWRKRSPEEQQQIEIDADNCACALLGNTVCQKGPNEFYDFEAFMERRYQRRE